MFEPALFAILEAGHQARFTASGDSMHPTIRDGESVIVEPCDPASLRAGEVVLTRAPRGLTAHRIVRITPDAITTRGDNALRSDPPLPPAAVVGRVVLPSLPRARMWMLRLRAVTAHVIRWLMRT
jgi:phage repressor protein C with HTH and peptisase S24 domain